MDDDEFRRFVERAVSWDAIYLGNGRHCVCLVPRDGNPADYGNHSCAPNTALVAVGEADRIALTDIAAGEELTIDYGTLSPVGWAMRCTCGAPACRGVVRGTIP
ncbi:MAG: SET domain-containing protein-lysine N-methyltransferase [Solirubrobacteraceae bacterium]